MKSPTSESTEIRKILNEVFDRNTRVDELTKVPDYVRSAQQKLRDTEVTDIDTRDPNRRKWQGVLKYLFRERGFRPSGRGKYSEVYVSDQFNWAVKVFMYDSAFIRWVMFSKDHIGNPYVPVFGSGVQRLSGIFRYVLMEKLEPSFNLNISNQRFLQEFDIWKRDHSHRASEGDSYDDSEYINEILDEFSNNVNLLDLHGRNYMARGNQLVVVDPYYNWFRPSTQDYTIDPYERPQDLRRNPRKF